MSRILLMVTALIFITGEVRAQGKSDSAAILAAKAAFKMASFAPDSAFDIAEKQLARAQRSNDRRLEAFAYRARGWVWMRRGSFEKAFADLLLAGKLFHELRDPKEEAYLYINLALAYSNYSDFTNSARYLVIADSLAQQLNDAKVKGMADRQMGILYREQGQYRLAIQYFRASMKEFQSLQDTLHYFDAAASLCIVYMTMSQPDSSLQICNSLYPLINPVPEYHYEKGIINERYGDVWFAMAKYDKAFESYGRAYALFAGDKDVADQAYEAINVGKTLTQLKRYREAENYLLLSYRMNDSLHMSNYTPDVAAQLANLYQATGDWRNAFYWQKRQGVLQDSLHLATQNERTAQLQERYEAEKREKEIELLRKDQQITLAVVGRQKAIRNGAVALAILLVIVGFLIINRYRVVQRAKRVIELEKMRNTIASDLHDDMGSALSSIHIISKMALKTVGGERTAEHLKKIHEHSGLILENMSDIVWTINPMNDSLEKVIFKMKEFAADMFDPLNIVHSFVEEGDLHNIKLGLQTRRDIYLVFKEAVNNAAKYSGCRAAAIKVTGMDGLVSVEVKDDGVGFSRESKKNGNGLRNMQQRARAIGGALMIVSQPGGGTTVLLRVPPDQWHENPALNE